MGTSSSKLPFVYRNELPTRSQRRALLLIDPQNDFIAEWGSLKVPGAKEDSKRVSEGIKKNIDGIDAVFVTLDTHQRMHIAHPLFWKDASGAHPEPFTTVSAKDVQEGKWICTVEEFRSWSLFYVEELDRHNKFKLTIWPEHCLVGTNGHSVHEDLAEALQEWEMKKQSAVSYLHKGNNALTEHYSAFKAEVPRKDDNNTKLNMSLIKLLDQFEEVIVAGQALSHCVNYSVRDLVAALKPASRTKLTVLSDGCSAIEGFEEAASKFRDDMEKEGVKFKTVSQVLGE